MNFREVLDLVKEAWPFSVSEYQAMPGCHHADQMAEVAFAINHVNLHVLKSCAAIGAEVERADHIGTSSFDDARLPALKQVVNSLRMAELVGVTAEELEQYIKEWAESKIPPSFEPLEHDEE